MVFNSFEFAYFLIPIFFLHWLVFKRSVRLQNLFLLICSVAFYALADWRFLGLLALSMFINYFLGIQIYEQQREKIKLIYLRLGVVFNLILLLYFKYFNFFYEAFYDLLNVFGGNHQFEPLAILLPLGISFFTFQTLSYLIDIYNEEVTPTKDLLAFSVFVFYFPKILSGPIERANSLMPQLITHREFRYDQITDGLRQILWGLFAKVVIAENCANIVDPIFENYQDKNASVLFLGAVLYAIQIYADFSGYSNMAIGVSKMFGINLSRNFASPFFSTNISDFWRKWHISLTTWMMDYVFNPLSFYFRRYRKFGLVLAIVITFILVGIWHGANWTFIVLGFLHGFYFIPLVYSGKINSNAIMARGKLLPDVRAFLNMLMLFVLIVLTDVFIRAEDVTMGLHYLMKIFSLENQGLPFELMNAKNAILSMLIGGYFIVEWLNREREHDFQIAHLQPMMRWSAYTVVFVLILIFGEGSDSFIYFQF